MAIKLIYSPICPPARSALLVSKALNLKVSLSEVNLLSTTYKTSDFKKEYPYKTVPALKDGKLVLYDSHCIAEYLVNKYGVNSKLFPQNIGERAQVTQKLYFDSELLYPRTAEVIVPILFRRKYGIKTTVQRGVKSAYKLLEQFLSKSEWLAGNTLSIADLCCITSISTLDLVVPVEQDNYPNLSKYIEKCKLLPYYEEGNQRGLNQLADILLERIILNKFIL